MIPKSFKKWTHLFEGAYNYIKDKEVYSTEGFNLYSNQDTLEYAFDSESISRARTGETLKVRSTQIFSDEMKFKTCKIEKHLGHQFSTETFAYNPQLGTLNYSFENKDRELKKISVSTSHNFHIQTPDAATTLVFAFSRSISQGSSISQKIYYVHNMWTFEKEFEHKSIVVARSHKGSQQEININGNKLRASNYTIYENEEHEKSRQGGIIVYLSKHYGIPYQIVSPDGSKIEIEFLNDRRESSPGLVE